MTIWIVHTFDVEVKRVVHNLWHSGAQGRLPLDADESNLVRRKCTMADLITNWKG